MIRDMIKGTKHSKETREKLRLAHLKNPTRYWLGKKRPHTQETKILMSTQRRGENNSFFGKKHTKESLLKMSLAHTGSVSGRKGKKFPEYSGVNHPIWKGDTVGYVSLHTWVVRCKGKPQFCDKCKTTKSKRYEWANIDGKYRRSLDDFIRLCVKCHRKFDFKEGKRVRSSNGQFV